MKKYLKIKGIVFPLVTDEENILWVVGYRTSDIFKITKDTKNVLVIQC